jgi:hypothetical protein
MKPSLPLAMLICGGLLGCGQAPEPQPESKAPPPPAPKAAEASVVKTVVDGFTGKAAVEQGKRASEQIKAISAMEQRDLQEALQP